MVCRASIKFNFLTEMKLHELKSRKQIKPKKRIGRGGKRGTFSGRGTKGQKSRAGRRIRKSERDLILRLPKKRGFRNKPKSPKPVILNLRELNSKLKNTAQEMAAVKIIDRIFLEKLNLIPSGYRGEIKILGSGDSIAGLTFKGLKFSKSAKAKVEKSGNQVDLNLK